MTLIHLIVLALVQGITEFLPISSSAHLVLVPLALGEPDQGVLVDIAVHVGTLVAVMVSFRADVAGMLAGGLGLLRGRADPGAQLALKVVAATVPVVALGLALRLLDPEQALTRSVTIIAWTTLLFGALLWLVDLMPQRRTLDQLSWRDALLIGLAQAVALLPGTSRSGITMTAARALGYARTDSARFSLLLSIPTILAAGVLLARDLAAAGDIRLTGDALAGGAIACISAFVAIRLMMAWLAQASFLPFVLYRLALGTVLLVWIYGFGGP